MRNLLIGLILGVSLTAAFTTSANDKGPQIVGESGRPQYAVKVNGFVECDDAWVNVPEKQIECDYEGPEGLPSKRREIVRH